MDSGLRHARLSASPPAWRRKKSFPACHGDIVRCVAFCTKEGKLDNLPFNGNATMLWQMALRRARPDDPSFFPDYLVGTVVVLFGDDEFMQAL